MTITRKPWKSAEIKTLKKLVADKTTDGQIATELGRTVSSIQQKRFEKGLVKWHKKKAIVGGGQEAA